MIKIAQISPFDYCNNKCWYCPNRYYEQPKDYIKQMSPELLEKIVKNLVEEKGKLVDEKLFIYTGMYNEILLYKYFPEMLEIFRKYKLMTMVLSNGTSLSKEKTDLIEKYKDVVIGINFNIPSFEKEVWCEETLRTEKDFAEMIENVKYVQEKLGEHYKLALSVGMNCKTKEIAEERVLKGKEIFPGLQIYPVWGLGDRVGLLHDKGVISNQQFINKNLEITGCNNGNRTTEWIHINALGKAFVCCNDYFFKYEFGDFNTQELKEIWRSDKHKEVLKQAVENLCSKCAYAKREIKRPLLTIGMASCNNTEQVWWTVQVLRMYQDLKDVEILVVDNVGDEKLKGRCLNTWGATYILANEISATAYPRDKVFENAKGEFVLCIDSHVMLEKDSVAKLKEWIQENRGRKDLFQSPMYYDDMKNMADSMNEKWEGLMYGTWHNVKELPENEYEIPMHGLGLFGCFKEAWLGFNKEHRGFGGEEGYIHEKFRQAGHKVICLPWLKWMHKFNDDNQTTKYISPVEDRIRNYLIGWLELGLDIQPIKDHFKDFNITVERKEENGQIKQHLTILHK